MADQHSPLPEGTSISWGNTSPQLCVRVYLCPCMCVFGGGSHSADQLPPGRLTGPQSPPRTEDQSIRHFILDSVFGAGMEERAGQCRVPTQMLPLQFPQPCPGAPQSPINGANPQRASLSWPESISVIQYSSFSRVLVFNSSWHIRIPGKLLKSLCLGHH